MCLCDFMVSLMSNFYAVLSDNMYEIISIPLRLLNSILWGNMWSILENVSNIGKKNMYADVGTL